MRHSNKRRNQTGFTLLEVVLALVLITLFMGTLFAVVKSSITASVEIEKVQQEDYEWSRFVALCRQTFESLPSTAILTLTSESQGLNAYQELTISGMPECLAFGVSPFSYQDTILALKPEPNQESNITSYFLGLYREDLVPKESTRARGTIDVATTVFAPADEQGRVWLPLLRDIQSLQWRFYEESSKEWKETWEESELPPLVELHLYKLDSTIPYRMVFSIPTTKLTQSNGTSTNRNSAASNNTGGQNGQGQQQNGNNSGNGQQGQQGGGRNGQNGGRGDNQERGRRGRNNSTEGQSQGGNSNNSSPRSENPRGNSQPNPPSRG